MNDKVIFLDCTLRDGGYYNAWDFPADVVQTYLAEMAEALKCYHEYNGAVELISVTPTTYPIKENSIYSPWL
tara:strand:+ start:331 stop:546 length:216 start_codon:yes stop_codon:yes gene_type:complete